MTDDKPVCRTCLGKKKIIGGGTDSGKPVTIVCPTCKGSGRQ